MQEKGILLAGYNGLTGSETRKQLNSFFKGKVFLLGRQSPDALQAKETWLSCDMSEESLIRQTPAGCDTLIICVGSTRKKAGSKEKFFEIDHDMVLRLARQALKQGVKNVCLVSSAGADHKSMNHYLKTKGLTEKDISEAGFESVFIFRPMMLNGKRREFRAGEKIALMITSVLDIFMQGPLLRFHSTPINMLAGCMLHHAMQPVPGVHVLENKHILTEGKNFLKKQAESFARGN